MGAEAAGSIAGQWAQSKALKGVKATAELEQAQLGLRLKQETIASEQQSIANLHALDEILATQRAMFAARGQMPGIGSAGAIASKSVSNYRKDEQARGLSMGFLKSQRQYETTMSKMRYQSAKIAGGMKNIQRGMNTMKSMANQADSAGWFGKKPTKSK